MWAQLPRVQTPTLILVGDSSVIATRQDMTEMSKRLPRGKLVMFEGYGQGVAFMIPERCVAEMKAFIEAGG
jgi:3-oxoadipate enol-lactonase